MTLKELEQYQGLRMNIRRLSQEIKQLEQSSEICGSVIGSALEPPYTPRRYTIVENSAIINMEQYKRKSAERIRNIDRIGEIENFIDSLEEKDTTIYAALNTGMIEPWK